METVRTAVELGDSTGKVALQGYCLGALMAFITAARYEVAIRKNTSVKLADWTLPS